ncbi:MAG: AmmeMemoRadiSam system radical SAM enzyme [Deltaproteobacteria bacterium]|nr:AmmeMemoRadiSam system radical SAM enzyme [Deltaproteobacteria bacterium]MBW2311846.1 AmmeMemoRadiSam system radical SAM enzyme [Deltaproteobacteria bacterium]RLB30048.1 MAG: AmmeMemoRadiSam system radical SAM enzyme [Deltaproteobacteria bacterium]
MKEAMLYEKLDDTKVQCNLCSHRCTIREGSYGICGVRQNVGGTLFSLVYDKIIAANVDPIEKKPLFHFYPGSRAYSVATVGCNFTCKHCQNADISQFTQGRKGYIAGDTISPEDIVRDAERSGCTSIAYTYTEPTIFFELSFDTAALAHTKGIKNVFVSNGYMTPEALKEISPYLDGINIDLKAFTDTFYKKICGARLEPVLGTIKLAKELGIWVEVTTLVIPTLNDSASELEQIAEFINGVDSDIPWHISQFYPTYQLTQLPRTPVETLHMARDRGMQAELHYVYEGNVPGRGNENTYCYRCGGLLIERWGYSILKSTIEDGHCPTCKASIAGVGL